MATFKETPQPRTFAPSKEDVLQNLQYFFGAPVSPEKLKDYSEHHAMTYHFPDAYAGNNVSIALKPTTQLPHCCVQMLTLSPRATHRPRFATRSTTSSSSRPRTGRPRCAQRHTHLKNLDVKQCALTTHHCSPGPVCRSACPSSRSRARCALLTTQTTHQPTHGPYRPRSNLRPLVCRSWSGTRFASMCA